LKIHENWTFIQELQDNELTKVGADGVPLFFQRETGYEFLFFTGERIAVYEPDWPGTYREAAIDWWGEKYSVVRGQ